MKYSILTLLLILSCATNKQLETLLNAPEQPLCKGSSAARSYSLTIMAYIQATKGVALEVAKNQTEGLSALYDLLAYNVMPRLLLAGEYRVTTDKENIQTLEIGGSSFSYRRETLMQGGQRAHWHTGLSFMDYIMQHRLGVRVRLKDINPKLLLIPSSPKGDQLIICPEQICKGLTSPLDGEKVVEMDVSPGKALGTEKNPYVEVERLDDYNAIDKDYFLFDLISKSQARIGNKFVDSYFVVPKMDQEKICNEMKGWNLGYPEGCFETGWKTSKDKRKWYAQRNERQDGKPKEWIPETYLGESGAIGCCDKNMNCNTYSDFSCEPNQSLKMKYMDAVVRDYILNKSFSVEKKNSGKWSIYNIKFDPTIMCKYGRDISELSNN